jgi:hypothetical protein
MGTQIQSINTIIDQYMVYVIDKCRAANLENNATSAIVNIPKVAPEIVCSSAEERRFVSDKIFAGVIAQLEVNGYKIESASYQKRSIEVSWDLEEELVGPEDPDLAKFLANKCDDYPY